jgi:hypothetical protein
MNIYVIVKVNAVSVMLADLPFIPGPLSLSLSLSIYLYIYIYIYIERMKVII